MEFTEMARMLVTATSQLLGYASDQMPAGWSVALHNHVGADGKPLYEVWHGEEMVACVRSPEREVVSGRAISRRMSGLKRSGGNTMAMDKVAMTWAADEGWQVACRGWAWALHLPCARGAERAVGLSDVR